MTSAPPALATALAYHQAWTGHNLDQAMTYIADDIICDAPGAQITGAQPYRDFLGGFMNQLTGVQTAAAFGDDTTGTLTALFYGRTHITGLQPGSNVQLRGPVGVTTTGAVMINPAYELLD